MLAGLLCATSTSFRLLSYAFLRVIPARQGRYILPLLFVAHLALLARVHTRQTSRLGARSTKPARGSDELVKEKERKVPGSRSASQQATARSSFLSPYPSPSPLRFLLSLPTSSAPFNLISLLINAILLLGVLDLCWAPHLIAMSDVSFSRVGAVTSTSARIAYRLPPAPSPPRPLGSDTDDVFSLMMQSLPDRILYRSTHPERGDWLNGPLISVPPIDRDHMQTVELSSLSPSTTYEYLLPPTSSDPRSSPGSFQTAPDPDLAARAGTHFSFLAGSCIKPNFPYSFFPLGDRLRIPGFKMLADWLDAGAGGGRAPSFAVFLGDFIYADVPTGRGKSDQSWFMQLYRQTWGNVDGQRIWSKLPVVQMWDDHEIENNFAGEGHPSKQAPFLGAETAYELYNGEANPTSRRHGAEYYDFDRGDVSFFVMDTRPFRSSEATADSSNKTMLGLEQKRELFDWLARVNSTASFKFLVSSVPFTTLWGKPDGHLDTWGGYRSERDEILDILVNVPNVVVISGDRHEFAAISLRSHVTEFSISPLSQFYVPFIPTLRQGLSRRISMATSEPDGRDPSTPASEDVYEEVILRYIPHGNYKWGKFEVDTRDREAPQITFGIWIEGKKAWSHTIIGVPVRKDPSSLSA